ncbi:MAG: aldo/keto reductase [Spirochaetia bacterium]|nr:aldo/keto reductase [Spirochaetia bacterium]
MIDIINQVKSNFPVTTFGASNWDYKRIETSHIYSFQNKLPVIRASEIHWSLATTDGEKMGDETLTFMNDESKKWYKTHMLPLFAYSSQAKGFFSKAIKEGSIEHLNDKIKRRYVSEENLQTLKKVENMCKEIGVSPASLILSYLTSAPFPTIAIIGPSSVEQIKDSLKDSDLILTEQQRKQLE